jgi:hypothetical protein
MALFGLDAGGNTAYVQAAGDGTLSNPYILQHDLLPEELKSAWVASTSGEVVVSGVASQKIRVLNALILVESGGTVQFQSGSAGELLTPPFAIASSGTLSLGNTLGVFETAVGEGLQTVVSSGIGYQTLITYREVAA